VSDILSKGLTVAATTYFSVTVFMQGSGDFSLIGLAISNIFMFASFGILAMRRAYVFYLNEHIPAIQELTNKITEAKKNGN